MNEKALMRKTKAELLKILKARGEKPHPKALKKDLVQLIVKSEPADEQSARQQPKTKSATAPKPRRKKAAGSPIAEAAVTGGQRRVEEAMDSGGFSAQAYAPHPPPDEPDASKESAVEPAAPAASPGAYTLPRRYDENRITAMVRDPYWIFVYWEVTPDGLDHARRALDGDAEHASLALRVYDVSDIEFTGENANGTFDIDVGAEADNWYINTGNPGRSYCVDIGLLSSEGKFHMIARSECVATPRATASDKVDDRWMSPEGEFEQVYALSGGLETGAASPDLHELMQKQLQARISS